MDKKVLGKIGENMAAELLRVKGYDILRRNYRCREGEIDIIAERYGEICFVEVKARTRVDYGMPRDAVDARKQWKLIRCAQLYLKLHPGYARRFSPRMDIVEILYRGDGVFARHTPNAFSLT